MFFVRLFFILMISVACGGSGGGGDNPSFNFEPILVDKSYINIKPLTGKGFASSEIIHAEIFFDTLIVRYGIYNSYKNNEDGTRKSGFHADDSFLMFEVFYDVKKDGTIEFTRSSCEVETQNPIQSLIPSGSKVEQMGELVIYANGEAVEFEENAEIEEVVAEMGSIASCEG